MAGSIAKLTNELPVLPRLSVLCVALFLRTGILPPTLRGKYTKLAFYLCYYMGQGVGHRSANILSGSMVFTTVAFVPS